ncbi:MAG: sugar phosphorylase [Pseudomonadota bacterium]
MSELQQRLIHHLQVLYPTADTAELAEQLLRDMRLTPDTPSPGRHAGSWDQRDIMVITYGNSVSRRSDTGSGESPASTLHRFLNDRLRHLITAVHILPFFPYSSDDGFAVTDYTRVNPEIGSWRDIEAIAGDYRLMADLVINHCSASHPWFLNFLAGRHPGRDYFFTIDPDTDLSLVVRPRTSELLLTADTVDGPKHVWCTFGHDQVDLDFRNPSVLIEFVRIIRQYLDHGVRIFRLDAVAFLWKEAGTSCLNLPQTHELVRLLRTLLEHADPDTIIITETNIPKRENLTYFGNSNEAHAIYNFSLPPLLLHTLLRGNCRHLKSWLMTMPPAQAGTFFLNFIASHDGIGLRPAEGLLSDEEIHTLIHSMERFGGRISWRATSGVERRPYEINIALWDALSGTPAGPDQWQLERFLCAHTILLALEGIPAFYVHSLVATGNDHERVNASHHNRHINRHHWDYHALNEKLDDPATHHHRVFSALSRLIRVRRRQPAFHPNATQFTLHLGEQVFAFWRQSIQREQSVFALNNISDTEQTLLLSDINLIDTDEWVDLISGRPLEHHHDTLVLAPYQCLWLSNLPLTD